MIFHKGDRVKLTEAYIEWPEYKQVGIIISEENAFECYWVKFPCRSFRCPYHKDRLIPADRQIQLQFAFMDE